MSKYLSPADVLSVFRRVVKKHGGNCARASRAIGISNGYLSDIINERKAPGAKALAAVGFAVQPKYTKAQK